MRKILAGSLFVSLVFSGGLSKTEKRIQEYVEKHSEEAIDLIEKVVKINSGTLNIDGNRTVGNIFQAELDQLLENGPLAFNIPFFFQNESACCRVSIAICDWFSRTYC